MIEFKAECGHTIRAKDEDEGKVVRCSYCGREAQVPQNDEDDLDFLFSEVDSGGSGGRGSTKGGTASKIRRQTKPKPAVIGRDAGGGGFDPFALALKMGYAAIIIIVLIVAGKYGYQAWQDVSNRVPKEEREERSAKRSEDRSSRGSDRRKSKQRGRIGLASKLAKKLEKKNGGGIYVNSVPPGAMVRFRACSPDAPEEIFDDPEAEQAYASDPDNQLEPGPGLYEIAVAVRINDLRLRDYPGYDALSARIRQGAPDRELRDYFLPDGAEEVTTVELPNKPVYLVRKYKVEVVKGDWVPVTALFLPDRPLVELMPFLPHKGAYGVNDEETKWELSFYPGVPKTDWKLITDALRYVGKVMYRLDDQGGYLRFLVHPVDGAVTVREVEDTRPGAGRRRGGRGP